MVSLQLNWSNKDDFIDLWWVLFYLPINLLLLLPYKLLASNIADWFSLSNIDIMKEGSEIITITYKQN